MIGAQIALALAFAAPRDALAAGDDDAGLVARARDGDRRAFDELYRAHVDLVARRLARLLGPTAEREDLIQQVFLEAYRGLDRFRGEAAFSTWLYRIVVNVAFDHLRRAKSRPVADEAELDRMIAPGATPEETARRRQELARALTLLDRLTPKKRIAFVLRTVEELPLEAIGELVGSNAAAVGQRVKHAQRELAAMVARERSLADREQRR